MTLDLPNDNQTSPYRHFSGLQNLFSTAPDQSEQSVLELELSPLVYASLNMVQLVTVLTLNPDLRINHYERDITCPPGQSGQSDVNGLEHVWRHKQKMEDN